jgi:hypothetical protein
MPPVANGSGVTPTSSTTCSTGDPPTSRLLAHSGNELLSR